MAYNLLKGKRGIITGALDENSIAWKVAEKAYEEGATFVLTNAPIAMRMGEINKLAEKTKSEIIPADATSVEELTNLFTKSQEVLGGKIDFVLHSIGMSVNIRKKIPYTESNYDYFMKGIDVSAISFHKMLAVAKKLDAINEWGSVVALTYMAAVCAVCAGRAGSSAPRRLTAKRRSSERSSTGVCALTRYTSKKPHSFVT